jgi:uncharacterized protein
MRAKETTLGLQHSDGYNRPRALRPSKKAMLARASGAVRWLHIYVSMLSFSALLFFSWTGITLNHPTWFGASNPVTRDFQGQLERSLLQNDLDRLEIAETLRQRHRLRGKVSEFVVGDDDLMVVFKGPAYAADIFIDLSTGSYSLAETTHGMAAMLNDLHKGRDSGQAWSLLIDLTAGTLILMSLTGFGLLLFLKRRRATGVLAAFVGTIVLLAAWLLFVP